jgi:hypothetical protein
MCKLALSSGMKVRTTAKILPCAPWSSLCDRAFSQALEKPSHLATKDLEAAERLCFIPSEKTLCRLALGHAVDLISIACHPIDGKGTKF